MPSFDRTSPVACTSNTKAYFFGYKILVFDHTFRRVMLAICAISAIPIFNLTIFVTPISCLRLSGVSRPLAYAIPPGIAIILLIVTIEGTIRSNHVEAGENQWTLGQTLSVFVTAIPAYALVTSLVDALDRPRSCSISDSHIAVTHEEMASEDYDTKSTV